MDAIVTRVREQARARGWTDRQVLVGAVVISLVLRIPFLTAPLGIDEGGYAYVASHWSTGSGGLYGEQWVDRPPLLMALYTVAVHLAGDLGIRLLGCIAAAVIVLACSDAARRIGGSGALRWSALVSAALVSNPALQAHAVNAELPAVAFVATSAWLVVLALGATRRRDVLLLGIGAGIAAASAVLVKQSFVDALVFAGVTLATHAWLGRREPGRWRVGVSLVGGVIGIAVAVGMLLLWLETIGPGASAMLDALYGFRIDARTVIDARPDAPNKRLVLFVAVAGATGLFTLLAFVVFGLGRLVGGHRSHTLAAPATARAVAAGLAAMGAYGLLAILLGGNWWRHYLIQLVPVLAIGTGVVLAASGPERRSHVARSSRRWSVVFAATTALAWSVTVAWSSTAGLHSGQRAAGDWLRGASTKSDTLLVTWGNANVLERSGLRTPYGLAWSLPVRVRDPHLREARSILGGDHAPTWIVEWLPFNSWKLDRTGGFRRLVALRYERVGELCGRPVYRLRSAGSTAVGALPSTPSVKECGSEPPIIFGVSLR